MLYNPPTSSPSWRLGTCELNLLRRELASDGPPEVPPRKVYELLVWLLKHRERVVTKQERRVALRPGIALTDSVLARTLMKARRLVRDSGGQPVWIGRAHGVAYRIIGPVPEATDQYALAANVQATSHSIGTTPFARPWPPETPLTLHPELAFSAANTGALLAWLALAASPASARWSPMVWRVTGRAVPLGFAVLYGALLLVAEPTCGDFNSLAGVQRLFTSPHALTAGWVHFLAFDLFVGSWIAQRAAAMGLPHWQVLPVLALTFVFGPLGYAAFIALRAVCRQQSLRLGGGADRPLP